MKVIVKNVKLICPTADEFINSEEYKNLLDQAQNKWPQLNILDSPFEDAARDFVSALNNQILEEFDFRDFDPDDTTVIIYRKLTLADFGY